MNHKTNKGIVVVAGAAQGIGRAIALKLARKGYSLVLNDILSMSNVEEELNNLGTVAFYVQGDVTLVETIQKIAQTVENQKKDVCGLVNSVYRADRGSILELSDEEWQNTWSTLFFSAVRLCRAIVPFMLKQDKGSIVNISSVHAV